MGVDALQIKCQGWPGGWVVYQYTWNPVYPKFSPKIMTNTKNLGKHCILYTQKGPILA